MKAPPRASGQLIFELRPPERSPDRSVFVPPATGASPLALIDAFVAGGAPTLVIAGPPGCGKSLLGRIALSALQAKEDRAIFADDVHTINDPAALLEGVAEHVDRGGRMILAGRGEPAAWARGLKDLETRLASWPRVALAEPDESQVAAVLARMFADRQMRVDDAVVRLAAARLPPRFAALQGFVQALEQEIALSLAPATGPLARKVLADLSAGEEPA